MSSQSDSGRFRHALALAQLVDGMTVVDWGCAHGWFSSELAARYPHTRVLACDIPYPHGEPQFAADNVEFQLLDESAPRLPIDDATVDRIFVLDVLEHMGPGSRAAALGEMLRVVRPDGMLIVTVPHRGLLGWTDVENVRMRLPGLHRFVFTVARGARAYDERYGSNRLANFSSDAREHRHYSESELAEVLQGAGFATRTVRRFGLFYALPWALSIALEMLRRTTGRRFERPGRVVERLYCRSADALPPGLLAESIGVSAAPTRVP